MCFKQVKGLWHNVQQTGFWQWCTHLFLLCFTCRPYKGLLDLVHFATLILIILLFIVSWRLSGLSFQHLLINHFMAADAWWIKNQNFNHLNLNINLNWQCISVSGSLPVSCLCLCLPCMTVSLSPVTPLLLSPTPLHPPPPTPHTHTYTHNYIRNRGKRGGEKNNITSSCMNPAQVIARINPHSIHRTEDFEAHHQQQLRPESCFVIRPDWECR